MSDQTDPIETEIPEENVETQGAQESPEAPDFDNMSDEDFRNFDPAAAGVDVGIPDIVTGPAQTLEDQLDAQDDAQIAGQEAAGAAAPEADGDQPADDAAAAGAGTEDPEQNHTTPHQSGDAPKTDGTPDTAAKTEAESGSQDYEALYKQVMRPFKANGKEFSPSSPEELVRLAQMGANYTKKMQTLAPSLKLMKMLENNGLLEESKLNFLIDLDKKTPAAIQKLLHDGKIDPLDLDVSTEPAYTPGNHTVSDKEMAFHETLGTVMETPTGKDTVSHINSQWDHASKQEIYKEPKLLAIIDEQRANGLYDRISAEVERRRILGDLKNVPFIAAYKTVGDELHAQGKLLPEGSQVAPVTPAPVEAPRPVLDTRPAARKPAAPNGDKAKALSSAPSAGKPASAPALDPFSMSDEEIMRITSLKV